MSADPFIQAPGNLQSHNRYAYVMNNPLNLTDPSGFSWWTKVRGAVIRVIAAAADIAGCGGYCSAAVGAYQGYKSGGFAGAIVGGINGFLGYQYGGDYSPAGFAIKAAGGCAAAVANGGDCGRGAVGGTINHFGGQYGFSGAVTAGCISAMVSGGRCGSGAQDAAISYAVSHVVDSAIKSGQEIYAEAQQMAKQENYRSSLVACGPCVLVIPPAVEAGFFLWRAFVIYTRVQAIGNVLNVSGADNEGRTRGLPPEGITPPAGEVKEGPASRPSEQDKGGKSLWDSGGGEWRYSPEDKWHNPHWDYNPHNKPSSPWKNVQIDQLPPRK